MSYNFRRFNARIGVVFKFQVRAARLFSWRRPTQTLSFLAVYTLTCLNPYLLAVLPPALLLVAVIVPSFVARHPEPPSSLQPPGGARNAAGRSSRQSHSQDDGSFSPYMPYSYSARGPPVAPPRTVKPVKELSRDFFRNMRDLQNSMADFANAHDAVVVTLVPATNFSDEARSSALFVALFFASLVMSISAHLLPWRLILLVSGWAATVSGHPVVARMVAAAKVAGGGGAGGANEQRKEEGKKEGAKEDLMARLKSLVESWVATDIILDQAPETREVEVFELQRRSAAEADEWEPWTFSPNPYDPLSAARLAGHRPPSGTRFFEDVLPPEGWEWSEKKWALDLWSREWVEERIITCVEVETEGERWVYDMYNENEGVTGVVEPPNSAATKSTGDGVTNSSGGRGSSLSWEEGFEGVGRRGEWRRRRWVRLVKRKKLVSAG